MLQFTGLTVSDFLISKCIKFTPVDSFKISINEPTGDFFYDSWIIKEEYKNSPWAEIIATLNEPVGEARIIVMKPGTCYASHADIDDRWHLNLTGQKSYLINLDNEKMYQLKKDNNWYIMDTSYRHTATNFGPEDRIQLVVRKLLSKNHLVDPINIKILPKINDPNEDSRFYFDDVISPWLNKKCKQGVLSNFKTDGVSVSFDIEKIFLDDINHLAKKLGFIVNYAN